MKTKFRSLALAVLSNFSIPLSSFAQGSLAPPGAPAPTMKSLDQIEAWTPVDAANTSSNITNDQVNARTSFPRRSKRPHRMQKQSR